MEAKHSCSNLMTFDSVVDTDLGIINYMIAKYKKSAYFNQYVVNASSENVKKNLLLAREKVNPITVLLKEEYGSSADDMLKDIKKGYMEEVLQHSQPTDILRFAKTLQTTEGVINCIISCKDELQKQYITKLDKSLTVIMDQTDMTGFDCLFLRYAEDVLKYTNMGGKYIFISNYIHNLDKETGLPKKVVLAVSGSNKIRTVDPYVGLTIPNLGGK